MKKIIFLFAAVLSVFLYSCNPQIDDIPNIGEITQAEFAVDDSNPNNLVFTAPKGYLYTWDFKGAAPNSHNQTVTVNYPFVGDYEVTFILSSKAGSSEITKTITVTQNDPEIGQKTVLKELTNEGTGKTWVYATDHPSGSYLYMVANYDWDEFWWDPYESDPPLGVKNEMKFDLDGGYNYTFFENESSKGEKGSFILDVENMTIHIANPWIPDYNEENLNPDKVTTGDYKIKSITDDELILYQDQTGEDFDYGWIWIFKPKS